MNDLLTSGPFTVFDYVALALILISGLIALARGFLRELASSLAFILAISAAAFAYYRGAPLLKERLPDNISPWIAEIGPVIVAFLIVYVVIAWLGRSFSRFVHAATDIGLVDRLAGLIFGLARGLAVIILLLLLAHMFIAKEQQRPEKDSEPRSYVEIGLDWVEQSYTYRQLEPSVIWVRNIFESYAKDEIQESLRSPDDRGEESE